MKLPKKLTKAMIVVPVMLMLLLMAAFPMTGTASAAAWTKPDNMNDNPIMNVELTGFAPDSAEVVTLATWDNGVTTELWVENGTRLNAMLLRVWENPDRVTNPTMGASTSARLTITGPGLEYTKYIDGTPLDAWNMTEINQALYEFPIWHTIDQEGVWTVTLQVYQDREDLGQNAWVGTFETKVHTNPTVKDVSTIWNFLLPIIIVLVFSAVCAISRDGISFGLFLATFGIGFTALIWLGLLPFYLVIVPVLLLVLMLFGGGDW